MESSLRASRRGFVRLLPLFAAVVLAGCGVVGEPSPASNASTAEPPALLTVVPATPDPGREIAVFGAENSLSFQEGVKEAAANGEFAVTFVPGGTDAIAAYFPETVTAAIVFLDGSKKSIPPVGFPVCVYASAGQTVDSGALCLRYAGGSAAADALGFAVAYPPHETPVRMIGLFTDADSPAYAVWREACASGRVFSKAEFFTNNEESVRSSVWFSEQLLSFYPGMIDAVFAETGELALSAVNELKGSGRDDMEVFAAASDTNADRALSPLFPAIAGADLRRAGELCYEKASALLRGEAAAGEELLPTNLLYSAQ